MWLFIETFMISLLEKSDLKHNFFNTKNRHYTNKYIKNQHNRFPFERVEDVSPLPGAGQNRPLPLLLPHTFRLRMIFSMVVLAPHGDVAKTFSVVRLAKHKLIVSVDAVVGVELLATTLAAKHMVTVLPNIVLARH